MATVGEPEIDEGFRRWYASCPCCLGQAYPEIRRRLDEEAREAPGDGAGCERCDDHEGAVEAGAGRITGAGAP